MSTQYRNLCEKLESQSITVKTIEEEFLQDRRICYICAQGHESCLSAQSLVNKSAPKKSKEVTTLCAECVYLDKMKKKAMEATQRLGFEVVNVSRKGESVIVEYRCTCGNTSSTDIRNLVKSSRTCSCLKCQNNDNKVDFSVLQQAFLDRDCLLLLASPELYTNNKQKLPFRCVCGNDKATIVYHDLIRGRLCGKCKIERSRQTSIEKYGVSNPSKHEDVKKKIVQTMQHNHGVDYAQQSESIRAKTDATSLEWYGVVRAFCLQDVYAKIRATHKQKYGVEFPLQCQEIQEKIDVTFVQSLGARRPFLSETFLEQMNEKYGDKWFVKTQRFKDIILERYGCETYLQSDDYKQKMLERYGCETYLQSDDYKQKMKEKYGVEHPMQNAQLFRKAQASSFRRKPYVSWDGRTFMLLGYEDKALDDLYKTEGGKIIYAGEDEEIPIFRYVGQDNKDHYYYPDFFIPDENRVIEVKSVYTYNSDPVSVLNKALAVSETYLFELRLYDDKKNLVEILECRNGMFYSQTQGVFVMGENYA